MSAAVVDIARSTRAEALTALVAELRASAAERDRSGGIAGAEVAALRRSSLLPLFVPTALGGGGASWSEVLEVLRDVASADSSTAHILLYHYFGSVAGIAHANGEVGESRARRVAEDNILIGTVAQAAYPPLIRATPAGDAFELSGSKPFTSGAAAADVLTVWVEFAPGSRVRGRDVSGLIGTVALDADTEGVRFGDDWDGLGQRRTVSGTTSFDGVRLAESDIITVHADDAAPAPAALLDVLLMYSGFAAIFAGIAQGAITEAVDYANAHGRPWVETDAAAVHDDALLVERVGRAEIAARSAWTLVAEAGRAVDDARSRGDALTGRERGEAAVAVSAARVHAAQVAIDVSSGIFEVTGARSATAARGLDRFWRNARTLSLHDPLRFKELEVGAHRLHGALPTPGFYS